MQFYIKVSKENFLPLRPVILTLRIVLKVWTTARTALFKKKFKADTEMKNFELSACKWSLLITLIGFNCNNLKMSYKHLSVIKLLFLVDFVVTHTLQCRLTAASWMFVEKPYISDNLPLESLLRSSKAFFHLPFLEGMMLCGKKIYP